MGLRVDFYKAALEWIHVAAVDVVQAVGWVVGLKLDFYKAPLELIDVTVVAGVQAIDWVNVLKVYVGEIQAAVP